MSATQGLDAYLDVEERDSKKIRSGNLRLLILEIMRHPGPLWFGFLLIITGTGASLFEPRLFGYAIDEAIVPRSWGLLQRYVLVLLGVIALRAISVMGQGYLFEVLGQRVTQGLRVRLFSHLQRLPMSVYDKTPAGRLLTRVTNDIASIAEMFTAGFVSMVSNGLLILGILVWLLVLDLRLGLIAASVFPLMIVATLYFSLKLQISYRESRSKLSALNAFLAENFMGMKIVHLFNRVSLHLQRFERLSQWYADAQISTIRVFAFFQPTITIASGISMALVIGFGGKQALNGGLKLGVLVAYFSYVLSLFQPVRELADKWNIFLSGMASAERVFSIFEWDVELEEKGLTAPAEKLPLRGHIRFENVWFAYDRDHWVLKDFSFEILPGQRIGVVGHTGAGKTTLISLLMRFYEPQRGRILLDGKDLREYDKRSLRASIGIVQQDVFIFSGSFDDNITFWGDSDGASLSSASISSSHSISNGKELQERGSNLSMGEKQVLAFARARAADPRIWILDEATANMDSNTEAQLQGALDDASGGKTTLLIAHRLATVRSADRILVLHRGKLVEDGSHEQLVAQNGLYARLYRFQAFSPSLNVEL